ncbi:hypothetical protein AYK25_03300 [Thermoplasmatales archaeon SM1-50]|nr:MAG: hypothetical protein AYK25_03300 [Thermoplasmatales archaeon SM1-50]
MKNQFMDIIKESCTFNPVDRRTMTDIHKTSFHQYSQDILSALMMKDHGENLLIKPLWATLWPAGPGNTMLPAITRVFPTSFDTIKRICKPAAFI